VGKLMIPDAILKKTGRLTEEETAVMRQHTVLGVRMLGKKPFYRVARDIAQSHHERWDGAGYPNGLKGQAIPLAARIVAVAGVFDALVHSRPYKAAMSVSEARSIMQAESGKAFDPAVLAAFMELDWEHGRQDRMSIPGFDRPQTA
jgi:putative two-component system response regulator